MRFNTVPTTRATKNERRGTPSESANRHASLNVNMCFPSALTRLEPPVQFSVIRQVFRFRNRAYPADAPCAVGTDCTRRLSFHRMTRHKHPTHSMTEKKFAKQEWLVDRPRADRLEDPVCRRQPPRPTIRYRANHRSGHSLQPSRASQAFRSKGSRSLSLRLSTAGGRRAPPGRCRELNRAPSNDRGAPADRASESPTRNPGPHPSPARNRHAVLVRLGARYIGAAFRAKG